MTVLTLCHFDADRELILEPRDYNLAETKYWAISHMWCQAVWSDIPGISEKVLASPQKARFIADRLPQIVGDVPFWMDILSVDQADEESRRAVVASIPEIYSNADVTLIIREGQGFSDCCRQLFFCAYPTQGNNPQVEIDVLADHVLDFHQSSLREYWLHRLRPLQELHLSRTIHFVTCEANELAEQENSFEVGSLLKAQKEANALIDLASTWAGLDDEDPALMDLELHHGAEQNPLRDRKRAIRSMFLRSLLFNERVSRTELSQSTESDPFLVLSASQGSQRKTGKARDFVLAIFPRFTWYKTPQRVELARMEFQNVFEDCAHQIRERKHEMDEKLQKLLRPKITRGMQGGFNVEVPSSFEAASDVPTPRTLGEFTNLFCSDQFDYGPVQVDDPDDGFEPYWQIRQIHPGDSIDLILEAVTATAMFTKSSHFQEIVEGPHQTGTFESIELDDIAEGSILFNRVYRTAYIVWYTLRRLHRVVNSGSEEAISFRETWNEIRALIRSEDALDLRRALLYLSTARALNFSVETVPFFEKRMQTYVLLGKHPKTNKLLSEVLIFGAQGIEVAELHSISAYEEENYPYVMASEKVDRPERVIGLTPPADFLASEFVIQLNRGAPEISLETPDDGLGCIVIKDTYL